MKFVECAPPPAQALAVRNAPRELHGYEDKIRAMAAEGLSDGPIALLQKLVMHGLRLYDGPQPGFEIIRREGDRQFLLSAVALKLITDEVHAADCVESIGKATDYADIAYEVDIARVQQPRNPYHLIPIESRLHATGQLITDVLGPFPAGVAYQWYTSYPHELYIKRSIMSEPARIHEAARAENVAIAWAGMETLYPYLASQSSFDD